mmetsp:Transcript_73704/g.190170  ORF Transcript_73704/g.190170 Transcript_73704/m.190170 type:complete len:293 (+) Transcript_73704:667-1545(+)
MQALRTLDAGTAPQQPAGPGGKSLAGPDGVHGGGGRAAGGAHRRQRRDGGRGALPGLRGAAVRARERGAGVDARHPGRVTLRVRGRREAAGGAAARGADLEPRQHARRAGVRERRAQLHARRAEEGAGRAGPPDPAAGARGPGLRSPVRAARGAPARPDRRNQEGASAARPGEAEVRIAGHYRLHPRRHHRDAAVPRLRALQAEEAHPGPGLQRRPRGVQRRHHGGWASGPGGWLRALWQGSDGRRDPGRARRGHQVPSAHGHQGGLGWGLTGLRARHSRWLAGGLASYLSD